MLGVRVALAAVAEIYALIIKRSVKDGIVLNRLIRLMRLIDSPMSPISLISPIQKIPGIIQGVFMRICFLMEPPRSKTSVTYDVLNGLQGSGADVEVVTERSGLVDLQNFKFDYDLYLFKSHSPLAESLAAAAHYRGAKLLNEYPATMKVRDSTDRHDAFAGWRSDAAHVHHRFDRDAAPRRARDADRRQTVARSSRARDRSLHGRSAVRRPDRTAGRRLGGGGRRRGWRRRNGFGRALIFAQEFEEHEPFDYKAYAIGDYVHAIKRVFPATTKEEKLEPRVGDDPELADLVRRCGEIFGLRLYGCRPGQDPKGFSVIEVNCFPVTKACLKEETVYRSSSSKMPNSCNQSRQPSLIFI